MNELLAYIDEELEKKSFSGVNDMEILPIVKAYDIEAGIDFVKNNNSSKMYDGSSSDAPLNAYYGKSAEMIGENLDRQALPENVYEMYCPIAFVLDSTKLEFDKIYPFDTNAAPAGLKIECYELGNTLENIQKYIVCFYGTNEQYIEGFAKGMSDASAIEARRLGFIHKRDSFDGRMHTVSTMIREITPLADYLKCVILPKKAMTIHEFKDLATAEHITFLTYKTMPNRHPMLYNQVIYELLMNYLYEIGVVGCEDID